MISIFKYTRRENKMRINQYLAKCGTASRRKCEEIVTKGRVMVNGSIITDLSFQVDEGKDEVLVDGKPAVPEEGLEYILLYKPKDVVSAVSSKYDEVTVTDIVESRGKRLFPVGRLDKDSSGLLLLTNDGDFAYRMTHPKFNKKKVYELTVRGRISPENVQKLTSGVFIDGEKVRADEAKLLKARSAESLLLISLHEGKNRQIRKMCEAVGHRVTELKRISEGGLTLGDLKPGEYRNLTQKEVISLMNSTKNAPVHKKPAEAGRPVRRSGRGR